MKKRVFEIFLQGLKISLSECALNFIIPIFYTNNENSSRYSTSHKRKHFPNSHFSMLFGTQDIRAIEQLMEFRIRFNFANIICNQKNRSSLLARNRKLR